MWPIVIAPVRWKTVALAAVLGCAVLFRLYHIEAPLVDDMPMKQVAIANKARNVAGPPYALFRNTFDFLDNEGHPGTLTEEFPLYVGLMGGCYRLFGQHEWFGRAWSILATAIAIAAFYDLVRLSSSPERALVAAFLFSMCPLLLFYGRSFQPDPSMLACMLATAAFYQRYLLDGRRRWWIAAALAGMLGPLFKNYALMVLIPLADRTRRHMGWSALIRPGFVLLSMVMAAPVMVWTALVFVQSPNPAETNTYFLFKMPELLWQAPLYERFFDRFLYKDCGPITALLLLVGVWAALFRKARVEGLAAWTFMGLLFYFLLGPKLLCHDYYGLMLLPAAALWGALGWQSLWNLSRAGTYAARTSVCCCLTVLVAVALVHSPWIMKSKFEMESGFAILGKRLDELCSASTKVIAIGSTFPVEIVHYSHHQGWVIVSDKPLAPDWRSVFANYRSLGARYLAIYLNGAVTEAERQSYLPLLHSAHVVEHSTGPWSTRRRPAEYFILDLNGAVLDQPDEPAQDSHAKVTIWP